MKATKISNMYDKKLMLITYSTITKYRSFSFDCLRASFGLFVIYCISSVLYYVIGSKSLAQSITVQSANVLQFCKQTCCIIVNKCKTIVILNFCSQNKTVNSGEQKLTFLCHVELFLYESFVLTAARSVHC